jgi:hypothetical protein
MKESGLDIEKICAQKEMVIRGGDIFEIKENGEELDEDGIKRKINSEIMNDVRIKDDGKKASYEQYKQMKESGLDIDKICAQKEMVIRGGDPLEIKEKLGDYVGAKGKYMPFTKSVELTLDFPELENIRVVDTPGVNDPIKSREARTEEYLRECDVVFIVSPAGQFFNKQDMELMDRLSYREGVREMFLVVSKSDAGIMSASIVEETDGDLNGALSYLRGKLWKSAVSALKELKSKHPEIAGLFDQIIDGDMARVITTSGLCHSMAMRYNLRDSEWSDAMRANLEHLAEYYPDNFDGGSCEHSLNLLGNMAPVREAIDEVRKGKKEIIKQKSTDYSKQQQSNTDNYLTEFIKTVLEKIKQLENSDLRQLAENKKSLENLIAKGTDEINEKINEHLDVSKKSLKEMLNEYSRKLSMSAGENIEETKSEQQITVVTDRKVKVSGPLGLLARGAGRFLSGGWVGAFLFGTDTEDWGYENESKIVDVPTLRAGAAKNQINIAVTQFKIDIAEGIQEQLKKTDKELYKQVYNTFRTIVGGDEIDYFVLSRAIKSMVQAYIGGVAWNFSPAPFDYGASRTISGDEVSAFEDALKAFLKELKISGDRAIKELFESIDKNKATNDPANWIFADTKKQLDILQKELETKETTLERLSGISKRLTALKGA